MITNNYNDDMYNTFHKRYINYQIAEQGENHYGEEQYFSFGRQVSKRKDSNNERADRRKLI
jgi:hypothetical protein